MYKNIMGGLIAGIIGAGLLVGVVELTRKPIDIPTAIKGEVGEKGETGARGATGAQGLQGLPGATGVAGKDGKDGKDGVNGKDASSVSITTLAKAVKIELDRDILDVTFTGDEGDSSRSLTITEDGTYDLVLTHFGSGAFDVSVKKSDGNLVNLLARTGHTNAEISHFFAKGSYTLYVSATNDWVAKVEGR
jgi:hypothetical protein